VENRAPSPLAVAGSGRFRRLAPQVSPRYRQDRPDSSGARDELPTHAARIALSVFVRVSAAAYQIDGYRTCVDRRLWWLGEPGRHPR
jgi:hypothetical protein